jgi:hypothetical protein
MDKLKQLIKESLKIKNLKKKSCSCGCNTCDLPKKNGITLNESIVSRSILSEGLKYHIDNKKPLTEHVYRAGSENYFNLWAEARALYSRNILEIQNQDDLEILTETNLGEFGILENGTKVPLDFPILTESKKKNKPIGKPMRSSSGGKAYKVYVKDPKTKKIKTVRFGSGGLRAKINDPKARKAFAARHKCGTGEPKTSPRYWSCRLPRFSKLLGLKGSFSGFW